jgi:hypothetical protein
MTTTEFAETFNDYASKVKDPRIERNKLHPLCEIFFLVLVALICGCNGWKDIEDFGWTKLAFLRKFYSYDNGIPSDDTIRLFLFFFEIGLSLLIFQKNHLSL